MKSRVEVVGVHDLQSLAAACRIPEPCRLTASHDYTQTQHLTSISFASFAPFPHLRLYIHYTINHKMHAIATTLDSLTLSRAFSPQPHTRQSRAAFDQSKAASTRQPRVAWITASCLGASARQRSLRSEQAFRRCLYLRS